MLLDWNKPCYLNSLPNLKSFCQSKEWKNWKNWKNRPIRKKQNIEAWISDGQTKTKLRKVIE